MQSVPLCGPRILARLESIAVHRLSNVRVQDLFDLMDRVNLATADPIRRPLIETRALAELSAAPEYQTDCA